MNWAKRHQKWVDKHQNLAVLLWIILAPLMCLIIFFILYLIFYHVDRTMLAPLGNAMVLTTVASVVVVLLYFNFKSTRKKRSEQKVLEVKEAKSQINTEKERHTTQSTESQEEYKHNVWEIYRKEWETANREKRLELNKRMLRWQELMKSGLTASQAYYRVMQEESGKSPQPVSAEKKTNTKSRAPSTPAVVVAIMLGFTFVSIPSMTLNISHFVLLPIGWFLSLFTGKPSALQAHFITLKLSPIFLVLVVPAIFYFYVWVPLCWIFFTWMVIYYISRRWTGAVQRDRLMEELLKEADATERKIKDFEKDKR